MKPARILLVEDEDRLRRLVSLLLEGDRYQLTLVSNGREGLDAVTTQKFDLIITDIKMPEMDGLAFLRALRERDTQTPVIVTTAFGSIESAVDAMREGAVDYLTKPFEKEQMILSIERALKIAAILGENQVLRREVRDQYAPENMVAESPQMREVLAMVRQVGQNQTTVSIFGESGTGKELVTRAIHESSPRARAPFVAINCAAIPEHLLESELFGHEKGAFTGAVDRKIGRFEQANGGTLFLDEVADMSLQIQAKLLRVLETQEFQRVGGTKTIRVDVRFIVATNKELRECVREGTFREDLYFRVNVFPLRLPPLRERKADILPLARFYLEKFAAQMSKKTPVLEHGAEQYLLYHPWPGNVRELKNVIERATILLNGNVIDARELSRSLDMPIGVTCPMRGSESFKIPPMGFSLEDHERTLLSQALNMSGNNKSQAAKLLGISRATLRYRLEKFGLDTPDADNAPLDSMDSH